MVSSLPGAFYFNAMVWQHIMTACCCYYYYYFYYYYYYYYYYRLVCHGRSERRRRRGYGMVKVAKGKRWDLVLLTSR